MDRYQSHLYYTVMHWLILLLWSLPCAFGAEESLMDLSDKGQVEESPTPQAEVLQKKTFLEQVSLEAMLSVPQPLLLGAAFTPQALPQIQVYLDGGYFRYPLSQPATVGISEYSIETGTRYYPTKSWWGVSLGMGYRNLVVGTSRISSFNVDGTTLATAVELGLSTFYISPTLEARIRLSENASLGFGVGLQIAIFASGSALFQNSNNGTNSNNSSLLQVGSVAELNRLAYLLFPRITLLRFSWSF